MIPSGSSTKQLGSPKSNSIAIFPVFPRAPFPDVRTGAKLKPYVVFVAPPTQLDRLNKLIASTTHQQLENCSISANELQAIVEEARDMEAKYGHYFDMVLSITDIDRAFNELLRDVNALEREPQWIPKVWLK